MSQPLLRIHLHGHRKTAGQPRPPRAKVDLTAKEAGQIIVVFALMLTVLIGLIGIAIDVTYAWRKGLEIQRAADAGSLAGVVYLPGAAGNAHDRAIAEVTRNGYTTGGSTVVTAAQNPSNTRQLDVTITAQAPTFFVRMFGVNNWTITRMSRAGFVMPVPMGSPLAYLGVGCLVLNGVTAPACATTGTGASGLTTLGTTGGTSLDSLGAWASIITKGGNEENGDAYAPENNSTYSPSSNVLYPASPAGADGYKGYFYTAVLPSGGSIQIFDPGFCAMGSSGSGNYGAGDHWIGSGGGSYPVSTYYQLWDTHDVPISPSLWTTYGSGSGSTFENEKGWDTANHSSSENSGKPSGTTACTLAGGADDYHLKWWTLASGLPAGTYEVQVSTTNTGNASVNDGTNAENMFAIQAVGGGSPSVYGYDKMCVYNNLAASGVLQKFYMAKVDQETGAGKTLTIDLFDVGDSTGGYIQILSPDTSGSSPVLVNNFSYSTFTYDASMTRVSPGNCKAGTSDSCSGSGRSKITVANGSNQSSFNNTWIEITIPLGTTYGASGLWQGGWWQVQYNVTAGNDTTTWSVNVRGNPVHLVPVGVG